MAEVVLPTFEEPPKYRRRLSSPVVYNGNPKSNERSQNSQAWEDERRSHPSNLPTWREFTKNTTFHGIKYIFDGDSLPRRIFWLAIVLGSMTLFISLVVTRTVEYYKYQTVISLKRNITKEIPFPAVTFCNLNQFRISQAVELGVHSCLNNKFGDKSDEPLTCRDKGVTPDTREMIRNLGHQMKQTIDNCWWQDTECNITRDFVTRLLDIGVCMTFNFDPENQKSVSETGPSGGLKLLLNIEKYEHMRGPNMDSGVKLLLHDPGELPALRDMGFVATPGEHTFVSIKLTKTLGLEHPWGECVRDGVSVTRCKRECFKRNFLAACDCMDTFMNASDEYEACSFEQKFECQCNERKKGDVSKCTGDCDCMNPCEENNYLPALSSSLLSRINLDTYALTGADKREQTLATFVKASEVQLKTSSDFQGFTIAAQETWESLGMIASTLQKYNDSRHDSELWHLYNLVNALSEDQSIFSPTVRAKTFAGMKCNSDLMYISTDLDILLSLRNISQTGAEAIHTEPGGCKDPDHSEWIEELYECPDKVSKGKDIFHGDHLRECMVDAQHYGPGCLESQLKCGCLFAGYYSKRGSKMEGGLKNAMEMYKSTLYEFTGISDINSKHFWNHEEHTVCLQSMTQVSHVGPLLTVLANVSSTVDKKDLTIEDFITYVRSLNHVYKNNYGLLESLTKETNLMDECCWIANYLPGDGDASPESAETAAFLDGAKKYWSQMRVEELQQDLEELQEAELLETTSSLQASLASLSSFLSDDIGPKTLSRNILVPQVQRFRLGFIANGENFARELDKIKKVIKTFEEHIDLTMDIMYNEMTIRILRDSDLDNSQLLSFLRTRALKNVLPNIISENCQQKSSKLPHKELTTLLKLLCSFEEIIETHRFHIVEEMQRFEAHSSSLLESLEKFDDATKMDENFFMDNFLQVDLFFESLQYEIVEEQKAFMSDSLFAEIGGFLGLLLGASVMTLCELIDYLILLLSKKKIEHADENTDHNST